MSPAVATRPPSRSLFDRLRSSRFSAPCALGMVLAGMLVAVNAVVFDDPRFVDEISFENTSEYHLRIDVRGDGPGTMPVGVAPGNCERTFQLIIDQGPTWHFRFFSQGRDAGEVVVARAELEASNWRYRVPDFVAGQLRSLDTPVPPPQSCPAAP